MKYKYGGVSNLPKRTRKRGGQKRKRRSELPGTCVYIVGAPPVLDRAESLLSETDFAFLKMKRATQTAQAHEVETSERQ